MGNACVVNKQNGGLGMPESGHHLTVDCLDDVTIGLRVHGMSSADSISQHLPVGGIVRVDYLSHTGWASLPQSVPQSGFYRARHIMLVQISVILTSNDILTGTINSVFMVTKG